MDGHTMSLVVVFGVLCAALVFTALSRVDWKKRYEETSGELDAAKKKIHTLSALDRLSKPPFSAEEMVKRIGKLDLSRVKKALEIDGWEESLIQATEKEYLRFLFLFGVSGESICPWTKELDTFWHRHILDMEKYKEDCLALFGMVFYHKPSLDEDLGSAEERTKKLYVEHFTPSPIVLQGGGRKKKKVLVSPTDSTTTVYQDSDSWLPWMMFMYILMNDSGNAHQELGITPEQATSLQSDGFTREDVPSGGNSGSDIPTIAAAAAVGCSEGSEVASPAVASCSSGSSSGGGSSCGGGGGGE